MFSGGKGVKLPSPPKEKQKERDANYPAPNSLFPQYSNSLPAFDTASFINNHSNSNVEAAFDPHAMSDGTPIAFKHHIVAKTPEASKNIPLHVQTDETMSDDGSPVQHPSDFPCFSPPRKSLIPAFYENRNQELPTDGSNGQDRDVSKPGNEKLATFVTQLRDIFDQYRRWIIIGLFFILLILVIALPISASRKNGGDSSSNASGALALDITDTSVITDTDTSVITDTDTSVMLPPMKPTTLRPTAAPTMKEVIPTIAPVTAAPVTEIPIPTAAPSTKAPTMNRNHPMIGILQDYTEIDILMDPYSPQGEAVAWLSTKDEQTPSAEEHFVQRYAMTVLDIALHKPAPRLWSSRNEHECRWPGVTCDDDQWVTGINWARQNLMGTIPSELGLLAELVSLDVAQNSLKGRFDSIYPLEKLKFAYLFENFLTGSISTGIENLGNLTRLFAGHNQLTGSIPRRLKMRPLEWFVMHFNQLTGTIPDDLSLGLTVVFDISHNRFVGTIPDNLAIDDGIIPNVRHLHLDHNQFTGSIPKTFAQLGKGRLRQLYLNDNKFGGAFPANWMTVKFLNNIDISNNNFRNNLNDMCLMSVFEYGELVEMRADCNICNCDRLCRTCRDNKEFKYEYDDDDWMFDDDER